MGRDLSAVSLHPTKIIIVITLNLIMIMMLIFVIISKCLSPVSLHPTKMMISTARHDGREYEDVSGKWQV